MNLLTAWSSEMELLFTFVPKNNIKSCRHSHTIFGQEQADAVDDHANLFSLMSVDAGALNPTKA
jgi:hypothetical protein